MVDFLPAEPVIFCYANASGLIGAGHVMRQLALSQQIRHSWSVRVQFVARECPQLLQQRLIEDGFPVHVLGEQSLADYCLQHQPDVLVIDDYHLTEPDWQAIRVLQCFTVVFDDQQSNAAFVADLVVNSAPDVAPEDYKNRVDGCLFALGPAYTLLRQEFLSVQVPAFAQRNSVLLTFGGADPKQLAVPVCRAVLERFHDTCVTITVVVGALTTSYLPALEQLSACYPQLKIMVNTPRMAELMSEAGLAITAAGSTMGELARMGVPSLALVCFDNQAAALESQLNGSWYQAFDLRQVDNSQIQQNSQEISLIADTAITLWHDQISRIRMSRLAQQIVDGQGGVRIAKLIPALVAAP
jgi:UDP-2,4-diacetamido-2,4,6-trideoxy-beta-L-altropyranose hydrolase